MKPVFYSTDKIEIHIYAAKYSINFERRPMMQDDKLVDNSSTCGTDCTCNTQKGSPGKFKLLLFLAIFIVAGTVLGNSILKKSRMATKTASIGYSTALTLDPEASSPDVQKNSTTGKEVQLASLAQLPSLSSLDNVAQEFDGVFILLASYDSEVTPAILKEITTASNAIASQGLRMGSFRLNSDAPDFASIGSQLPPPGILVAMKGRGMRGISCANVTQDKLLQTCIAAMNGGGGCCPSGRPTPGCSPGNKSIGK